MGPPVGGWRRERGPHGRPAEDRDNCAVPPASQAGGVLRPMPGALSRLPGGRDMGEAGAGVPGAPPGDCCALPRMGGEDGPPDDWVPANRAGLSLYTPAGIARQSEVLVMPRRNGVPWRPFFEAWAFVRALGLKNVQEWQAYGRSGQKPDDIPSGPAKVYASEWRSFGDWLGTGTIAPKRKLPPGSTGRRAARLYGDQNMGETWRMSLPPLGRVPAARGPARRATGRCRAPGRSSRPSGARSGRRPSGGP